MRFPVILLAGATLALGAASYAWMWRVHLTEWVFASEEEVVPSVQVFEDTEERPKSPRLETEGLTGVHSFGERSTYIGLGVMGGSSGWMASPGIAPIYWSHKNLGTMIAPPGLPIRHHFIRREWVAPRFSQTILAPFFVTPTALIAAFVNFLLLPPLLRRMNPSGVRCPPAMRQGMRVITRWTCIGLIGLGVVWAVLAMNPANWLIDHSNLAKQTARILLVALVLIPAVVAALGILRDRARILFHRRFLSVCAVVLCHVLACSGLQATAVFTAYQIGKHAKGESSRAGQQDEPTPTGRPAPTFTLPMVRGEEAAAVDEESSDQDQGETVSLVDFRGRKVVLLTFWATWCSPCLKEIPALCKLHEEFSGKGLAIVGINTDHDIRAAKSLLKKTPLPYAVLHDDDNEAAKAYGIKQLPYTILIDKSGMVVRTWRGWIGEEEEKEIREEVAKLLAAPASPAVGP